MKTGIPEINSDDCNGCGDCVEWCPTGAVKVVNGKAIIVNAEDCHYCTDCETVCSTGAIMCPFEIILVRTRPVVEGEE